MKRFLVFLILTAFMNSCSLPFKEAEGIRCDKDEVIKSLEELLNKNIFYGKALIEVDRKNIVVWDYKSRRYLCKAKIKGDIFEDLDAIKSLALTKYGIQVTGDNVSGWVYYTTYASTYEWKRAKEGDSMLFYVELVPPDRLYTW